ncbi:MAG TPA: DUF881 domain-containing protein [Acidimicrobiales bacterium]|nr:DUF881 domain-containing protein [Acidimicrobiales bacterium]
MATDPTMTATTNSSPGPTGPGAGTGAIPPGRRRSPAILVAATLMAFLAVLAVRARPADPETRLPARYRLADLIEQQQRSAAALRREVAALRTEVDLERAASTTRTPLATRRATQVAEVSTVAGLVAVTGPGLEVTLDDSKLDAPPSGSGVNDLVIHSQDVQAVVNALWRSGAEALSINGQRLVGTSAVLCVGNTLLLNGTVHSPPYVVRAVGASRDRFDADRLVRRVRQHAGTYGLTFTTTRKADLELPAYRGSTKFTYARPVT